MVSVRHATRISPSPTGIKTKPKFVLAESVKIKTMGRRRRRRLAQTRKT